MEKIIFIVLSVTVCVVGVGRCYFLSECNLCNADRQCVFALLDNGPRCVPKSRLLDLKAEITFPSHKACRRYLRTLESLGKIHKPVAGDKPGFVIPPPVAINLSRTGEADAPLEPTQLVGINSTIETEVTTEILGRNSTEAVTEESVSSTTQAEVQMVEETLTSSVLGDLHEVSVTDADLVAMTTMPSTSTEKQEEAPDMAAEIPATGETPVTEPAKWPECVCVATPTPACKPKKKPRQDVKKKQKKLKKKRESVKQKMYREVCEVTHNLSKYLQEHADVNLEMWMKQSPVYLNYHVCDFLITRVEENY